MDKNADAVDLAVGAAVLTRHHGRAAEALGAAKIDHATVVLNGRTEEEICAELIATGAVEFAEPDYAYAPSIIPNDPSYGLQWHHPKINSPAAWDSFTGDGSITVAVCDTGIQSDHPDLAANLQLPGFNTVDNSTNTEPIHYHGTFVAGCIGAVGNNSLGVTGVAWDVKIVPLKISNRADGLAYISDMAKAIQWAADNGAKIINLSYGGASSATIDSAAQYARGLDSLLFMSAGNDNSDISAWPDYTSFVLVGATDSSDARSSFSNYGTPIDITGPGSSIYSTTMGSSYRYSSGTSFSSPIAAGVAAMMRMAKPSLTVADLETRLYSACVDLGAAGEDSIFGHGRVDLQAALQAALGNLPPTAWDAVEFTDQATPINSTLVATDGDDDPLTHSIVSNGSAGTALITNASTGAYTYTPNGGTNGTIDSFTFKANDGTGDSNVATVTVAILAADSIWPAPGSTFASDTQRFYWSPVSGATAYMIWVGSQAGTGDYFASNSSPDQYVDITGLPTDGSTVYVRHLYWVSSAWNFSDYTYTALDTAARITSPANGTTLGGASQLFQWSTGTGNTQYWLEVGTAAAPVAYYTGDMGASTSYTVNTLPTDGSAVQVRLWSYDGSAWVIRVTNYTAATIVPAPATMTSPANGATLDGASQLFQWDAGTGNTQFWFEVGTAAAPVAYYSGDMGVNVSYTVNGLPTDSSAVQVRLWSYDGSAWLFNTYNYTAAAGGGGGSSPATMTSPANGATLDGVSQLFQWDAGTGNTQFWFEVGTAAQPVKYFAGDMGTNVSYTVNDLPTNSSAVQVRLWSYDGSAWVYNTYNYTAAAGGGGGSSPATMTSPANGATLDGASQLFQWDAGSGNTQFWLEVGTSAAPVAYYSGDMGMNVSYTVNDLPTNGSAVQVRLWSYDGSVWTYITYAYTAAGG